VNGAAGARFSTQFDSTYDSVPSFAYKARVHDDSIPPLNEDPLVKATERNMHGRSASLFMNSSKRDYTGTSTMSTDPDFMGFTNSRGRVEDQFNAPPPQTRSSFSPTRRSTMGIKPRPELTGPLHDGVGRAIALYRFEGQEVSS
jgi:hypothetical protein